MDTRRKCAPSAGLRRQDSAKTGELLRQYFCTKQATVRQPIAKCQQCMHWLPSTINKLLFWSSHCAVWPRGLPLLVQKGPPRSLVTPNFCPQILQNIIMIIDTIISRKTKFLHPISNRWEGTRLTKCKMVTPSKGLHKNSLFVIKKGGINVGILSSFERPYLCLGLCPRSVRGHRKLYTHWKQSYLSTQKNAKRISCISYAVNFLRAFKIW